MSKTNPLFVDSTKIGSDSIGCRIELNELEIESGQSVYVKFCDASGFEESTQLQKHPEENLFFGKIWLNHQQEIRYQFYVMGESGIIRTSVPVTGKATYIMENQWVESESKTVISIEEESSSNQMSSPLDDLGDLSSLIDKWGL